MLLPPVSMQNTSPAVIPLPTRSANRLPHVMQQPGCAVSWACGRLDSIPCNVIADIESLIDGSVVRLCVFMLATFT
jgi:hypothetical protein